MTAGADSVVLQVFQALGHWRTRLGEFRRLVQSTLRPAAVEWNVACNNYETGLVVSAYLEADLGEGWAVVWWLDLTHDGERWRLDPRVTWNGRDAILPLGEKTLTGTEELLRELPHALDFLFETHDAVHKAVQELKVAG